MFDTFLSNLSIDKDYKTLVYFTWYYHNLQLFSIHTMSLSNYSPWWLIKWRFFSNEIFSKNLLWKHCLYKTFGETYIYMRLLFFFYQGRLSAQTEWLWGRKSRKMHDYNLVWSEGDLLTKNVTFKDSGLSDI